MVIWQVSGAFVPLVFIKWVSIQLPNHLLNLSDTCHIKIRCLQTYPNHENYKDQICRDRKEAPILEDDVNKVILSARDGEGFTKSSKTT